MGIHAPECKADGGYDEVQCHVTSGYCWCVDEYGNEVQESRIKGRPSCGKSVNVNTIIIVFIFVNIIFAMINSNKYSFYRNKLPSVALAIVTFKTNSERLNLEIDSLIAFFLFLAQPQITK